MSDTQLVCALRDRVLDEVRRAVPPGPVALLDFPNYGNPGDSAIWLGALACLSALGFSPPVYTSDHPTFDERMLRRSLPRGTILLTGGGNFGDLWPQAQVFRERVLRAFPDHAIVQLPQTIHFAQPAAMMRARPTLSAHQNFTILVRDARSLELATADLGCRASLCPDLAFCLTPESELAFRAERSATRPAETLHLLRTDHESAYDALTSVPGRSPAVDWVQDVASPLTWFTRRLGRYLAGQSGSVRDPSTSARAARATLSACYPEMARRRLRRGSRLLRSARVIVTDRLHGHVLALLLGVPHVALGDRNGKLRGFVDTWTSSASLLRWADTPAQAADLSREFLSRDEGPIVARSTQRSGR